MTKEEREKRKQQNQAGVNLAAYFAARPFTSKEGDEKVAVCMWHPNIHGAAGKGLPHTRDLLIDVARGFRDLLATGIPSKVVSAHLADVIADVEAKRKAILIAGGGHVASASGTAPLSPFMKS